MLSTMAEVFYSLTGNFFNRKSTIRTAIAATETNKDINCLQK